MRGRNRSIVPDLPPPIYSPAIVYERFPSVGKNCHLVFGHRHRYSEHPFKRSLTTNCVTARSHLRLRACLRIGAACPVFVARDGTAVPFTWDKHHLSYEFALMAGEKIKSAVKAYIYR